MIFDWSATAALAAVQNTQPEAPLTLSGEGLWVCLVSSGTCTASLDDIGPSPAGSALILPPQNAPALPPLVQEAMEDIRANYAGLYGVEELSERLGVSKSHLVRMFTAALGIPPGRYLTKVRVEAAMRLLLHREYTLDVIASLCGFSGANYLCRVFKKETGHSPAQWRAMAGQSLRPGLSPEESQREQELYI